MLLFIILDFQKRLKEKNGGAYVVILTAHFTLMKAKMLINNRAYILYIQKVKRYRGQIISLSGKK